MAAGSFSLDEFSLDAFSRADVWYPALQQHTFPTMFVSLSSEELQALAKYCEAAALLRMVVLQEYPRIYPDRLVRVDGGGFPDATNFLEEKYQTVLEELEKKIDEELKPFVGDNGPGAFVRLSTCSPKDSVMGLNTIWSTIDEEAAKMGLPESGGPEAKARLYWRTLSKGLRITSGKEAMYLMKNSRRIHSALVGASLYFDGADDDEDTSGRMQLVIREWADIDPELEFRTFVAGDRITAITHYYGDSCFVPEVIPEKEHIQELILQKHEEVLPLLQSIVPAGELYTVDYVLDSSLSNVMIVEINVPPPGAGTGLFDWDNELDKAIIEGKGMSHDEVHFRIQEVVGRWEDVDAAPAVREYIDRLFDPSGTAGVPEAVDPLAMHPEELKTFMAILDREAEEDCDDIERRRAALKAKREKEKASLEAGYCAVL